MNSAETSRPRYLGMVPGDLAGKAYAPFWNPQLAPLPEHVREAVAHGPIAGPLLPPLAEAARCFESGGTDVENGFALVAGGTLHVAVVTEMPGVSPEMIDWWFGWHSDEPERYKLWHPQAHVYAAWQNASSALAGAKGRARYVGQTSCVDEYIGSTLGSYAIRFLPPGELGLDEVRLADAQQATCVCARTGFEHAPLDFGYLAHDVERTATGSTMRSRFWIGGEHAAPRRGGPLAKLAVSVTKRFLKPGAAEGAALLVHCSQEMSHLASFLPRLYARLGNE